MCEQGEDFLASLAGVVDSLASEVPAARLDRKALAALSAGLQQFQEDALGVKVTAHPLLPVWHSAKFLSKCCTPWASHHICTRRSKASSVGTMGWRWPWCCQALSPCGIKMLNTEH